MASAMALALAVAVAAAVGPGFKEALASDDSCQPDASVDGKGGSCDLSLRQLRREQLAACKAAARSGAISLMQVSHTLPSPALVSEHQKANVEGPSTQHAVLADTGRTGGDCGNEPELDGQDLETLISGTQGVLLIAMPQMRCTQAALAALQTKGLKYTLKEFQGDFSYAPGASDVWDWLHCKFPDDKQGGTVMHSYVFSDGAFIGQGFAAADKVTSGDLGGQTQSCEKRFPQDAEVVKGYMGNTSNRVLLFGWISCPCVGIAQARFAASSLCYEGRQWANPSSGLMAYLQCKENDPQSHSFIYFRESTDADSDWTFVGNGFALEDSAMSEDSLNSKISAAGAATTCKRPSVKNNLYGTQLEECRVGNDNSGSWMDDGTCSEQTGGIHQICIESLPADFSSETHQSPWSEERKGKRHCVCVGAWSLYMTDADKHKEGAESIMPHCKSIPETVLSTDYLGHWRDWNGYPASVLHGIRELVSRCLEQADDTDLKCGLKERFEKLQASTEAKELKDAKELQTLADSFHAVSCPSST